MGNPSAVKKGAEAARARIKQVQDAQAKAEEIDNQPAPDLDNLLSGSGGEGDGGEGREPERAPEGNREPPRRPPAAPEGKQLSYDELEREYDRLQQQHRVLKGKYDSEVPRLKDRVDELEKQLQQAGTEGSGRNTGDGSGDISIEKARQALLNELPSSTVDAIFAVLQSGGNRGAASKSEIDDIRKRLEKADAQSFEARMTALESDWEVIDANPEFAEKFLWETEGNTGRPKGVFYEEAAKNGDAKTCAAYIREFKKRRGAPANQPPPDPGRDTGDRQQQTDSGGNRTFRRSEIRGFEAAVRRGEYRGKEEQVSKVRRMFRHAVANGRVIEDIGQGV